MPLGQMKVVNISELPSTRDYGEHDPWKKKMQELEERRARGEVVEEEFVTTPLSSLDHPQFQQSAGTTILPPVTDVLPGYMEEEEAGEEEEEGIEYRLPKGLRMEEAKKQEKPGKKKKQEAKKKVKKAKSAEKPAKTKMYLKPMSPDFFGDSEEEEEEEYEEPAEEEEESEEEYEEDEEEEEEEEEVKPVRSPLRNLQLSLRKPAAEKEIIKMEVGLPPGLG